MKISEKPTCIINSYIEWQEIQKLCHGTRWEREFIHGTHLYRQIIISSNLS